MRNGVLRVLGRDDLNYLVEIEALRSGINRNKWDFRNIRENAGTFRGVPILTAYVGRKIGDGHNMDEKTDPQTGETYYSTMSPTAERIVGMVGENEDDIRVEERDGQEWVIARGKLWRFYHKELVDKIASLGRMDVSAETEVFDEEKEGDVSVYSDWRAIGITILGDHVRPAVPGANVKAMREMGAEFERMKIRAAQEAKQTKQGVNKRMNRTQMAELEKLFGGDCRVLSVEDSHVALLRNGDIWGYTFGDEKDTVIQEHFEAAGVRAVLTFADGTEMDADLHTLLSVMHGETEDMRVLMESEKKRADAAEETLKKMREAEGRRRVEAVKAALRRRLEEIRGLMDVDGAEELCNELCGHAEEFACDCEGDWKGDEKACAALDAKCMEMHMQDMKQKREREKRRMAWDLNEKNHPSDGIEGALQRIQNRE